ncbi:phage protein U [Pseudomonas sp. GM60]|nr:phage protein U [Pseudomonas sp. GM60]
MAFWLRASVLDCRRCWTARASTTPKGQIFPGFKGGLKQLDTLRSIGGQLQPLTLTTGYGDVLGTWCLESVDEDQSALMQGGIPRKQEFTLEFTRYGDDMQNV